SLHAVPRKVTSRGVAYFQIDPPKAALSLVGDGRDRGYCCRSCRGASDAADRLIPAQAGRAAGEPTPGFSEPGPWRDDPRAGGGDFRFGFKSGKGEGILVGL